MGLEIKPEDLDKFEKDEFKAYCNTCYKNNGKLSPLEYNSEEEIFIKTCNCRGFYNIRYSTKTKEFELYCGQSLHAETMSERTARKQAPGECSLCKKWVEERDTFSRGISCGCHDKWYVKHNNEDSIVETRKRMGEINSNLSGYCKNKDCKHPEIWHAKLNVVGFVKIVLKHKEIMYINLMLLLEFVQGVMNFLKYAILLEFATNAKR